MPLKSSRNEQHAVVRFLWAKELITLTHPTVQTWLPVTIIFLRRWRNC